LIILDNRIKMGLISIKGVRSIRNKKVKLILKASENERPEVITLKAPGMTIAYFGYGNPTHDTTDLTIQGPDFGTNVTWKINAKKPKC
jgi:hypothetical protein